MSNPNLLTDKEAVMNNLRKVHEQNTGAHKDRVNGLIAPDYLDCDMDALTVTAEFEVLPWELNRAGILHGGAICAILDHIAGITVSSFADHWAPTVDMDVRFISAGKLGDKMIATGKIVTAGRRIFHVEAVLVNKATGRTIATSTATYLNTTDK